MNVEKTRKARMVTSTCRNTVFRHICVFHHKKKHHKTVFRRFSPDTVRMFMTCWYHSGSVRPFCRLSIIRFPLIGTHGILPRWLARISGVYPLEVFASMGAPLFSNSSTKRARPELKKSIKLNTESFSYYAIERNANVWKFRMPAKLIEISSYCSVLESIYQILQPCAVVFDYPSFRH